MNLKHHAIALFVLAQMRLEIALLESSLVVSFYSDAKQFFH